MDEYLIRDDRAIRSYFITPSQKFAVYTVILSGNSMSDHGELILFNCKDLKSTHLKLKLPVNEGNLDFALNSIHAVEVPIVSFKKENAKVDRTSWVVLATGDAICALSFDDLLDSDPKIHKWQIANTRDCITSFEPRADANGNLQILYTTKLGEIRYIKFNTIFYKWSSLYNLSNAANDSLTSVSFGTSGLTGDEESLIGSVSHAMVSGFDNQCRLLLKQESNKFRIEVEELYSSFNDDHILTSIDYLVTNKAKNPVSYDIICCGNITNLGCTVYRRTARGEWNFVIFLERQMDKMESISTVNCVIVTGTSRGKVSIYSGSENGKLYEWDLDYKEGTVCEKKVHSVGSENDVIHKIKVVGSTVYFAVNTERIGKLS